MTENYKNQKILYKNFVQNKCFKTLNDLSHTTRDAIMYYKFP